MHEKSRDVVCKMLMFEKELTPTFGVCRSAPHGLPFRPAGGALAGDLQSLQLLPISGSAERSRNLSRRQPGMTNPRERSRSTGWCRLGSLFRPRETPLFRPEAFYLLQIRRMAARRLTLKHGGSGRCRAISGPIAALYLLGLRLRKKSRQFLDFRPRIETRSAYPALFAR